MRSEFYEVFKDAYDYCIDDVDIHRYESAAGLADRIWHHQQAKVDELQKRVDALTLVMEGLLEEMKYPTATFEEVICSGVKELEQALKGGGE